MLDGMGMCRCGVFGVWEGWFPKLFLDEPAAELQGYSAWLFKNTSPSEGACVKFGGRYSRESWPKKCTMLL
jgi:hypothetical protein